MGRTGEKFVLFMLALFAGSSALASGPSDCPAIDLREVFPLKMRDQGDISWCYAHASADYLQFFHRVPEQISAADIAIRYNQGIFSRFLNFIEGGTVPETGFARTALWNTEDEGYCPESVFPSDFWKKVHQNEPTPRIEMRRLKDAIEDIYHLHEWVRDGVFKNENELPFIYSFPSVTPRQFFEALQANRRRKVLKRLREAACDGSRKEFPTSIERISMGLKAGTGFWRIHQTLARGLPVSADFFYGLLDHPEGYSTALSEFHTALVVGQRYSTRRNECEYLIKDSYGSGCAIYSPLWECENGNVWVGENAFKKALISTVVIEE